MTETRPTRGTTRRPAPVPGPSEVPQYGYGWLVYVLAAVVSVVIAYIIFKLHYTYGQAPHRIMKMLAGLAVLLVVLVRPKLSLHIWLLAIPIGEWLPATGVPGLNGPNLLIVIMVLSWIIPRVMRGDRLIARTRLRGPIAAYLAIILISLVRGWLFPPGPGYEGIQMMKSAWQVALGFLVYYVAANVVVDKDEIKRLLLTFAAGVTLGALIAVRQFIGSAAHRRVAGAMGDINDLGAYFAMTASALIGLFLATGMYRRLKRWFIGAAAALATYGVMIPKSRGGYVGAAAGIGVLTYMLDKRIAIVFALVLALSPVWAPGFVQDRVAETTVESFEAEFYGDATDRLDPSAGVRLEIWKVVARESMRSPIIGFGYGAVPYLTAGTLSRPFSAHSLYFATLGESGLIGLAVLTWLIWACFASGRELLRRASDVTSRGLAIAFLGATVALLLANVFGQRFTHISIAGTYFFMAGLVDRSIQIERTKIPPEVGEEGEATP